MTCAGPVLERWFAVSRSALAKSADDLDHALEMTRRLESFPAAGRVTKLGVGGHTAPHSILSSIPRPAQHLASRVLPVREELAGLFPQRGLRRGSTVAVRGSTSLLLALLASATASGSWAGIVGMPDLGVLAAAELGVAVHRLALVPRPGGELVSVVASLLDGVDLVAVATEGFMRGRRGAELARRLSARARHRGSVIIGFGPWPGADIELSRTAIRWSGLGAGHGYLSERELVLSVSGRGAASRGMRARVVLSNDGDGTARDAVFPHEFVVDRRAEAGCAG